MNIEIEIYDKDYEKKIILRNNVSDHKSVILYFIEDKITFEVSIQELIIALSKFM